MKIIYKAPIPIGSRRCTKNGKKVYAYDNINKNKIIIMSSNKHIVHSL